MFPWFCLFAICSLFCFVCVLFSKAKLTNITYVYTLDFTNSHTIQHTHAYIQFLRCQAMGQYRGKRGTKHWSLPESSIRLIMKHMYNFNNQKRYCISKQRHTKNKSKLMNSKFNSIETIEDFSISNISLATLKRDKLCQLLQSSIDKKVEAYKQKLGCLNSTNNASLCKTATKVHANSNDITLISTSSNTALNAKQNSCNLRSKQSLLEQSSEKGFHTSEKTQQIDTIQTSLRLAKPNKNIEIPKIVANDLLREKQKQAPQKVWEFLLMPLHFCLTKQTLSNAVFFFLLF